MATAQATFDHSHAGHRIKRTQKALDWTTKALAVVQRCSSDCTLHKRIKSMGDLQTLVASVDSTIRTSKLWALWHSRHSALRPRTSFVSCLPDSRTLLQHTCGSHSRFLDA
jgi:hypothetical protein